MRRTSLVIAICLLAALALGLGTARAKASFSRQVSGVVTEVGGGGYILEVGQGGGKVYFDVEGDPAAGGLKKGQHHQATLEIESVFADNLKGGNVVPARYVGP